MRHPGLLAVVAVVCSLGPVLEAEPTREAWEPAKTWALLVGVLEWADPALAPFPKAGRVDRRLEATLVARGVPAAQITFLEDGAATLAACRTALESTARAAGEGSTLIVYFAGHGLQVGTRTWFAPADTRSAEAQATAWEVAEIGRTLAQRWRGKRLLLLADCCHSGALEEVVAGYDGAGERGAASLTSALDCNVSTANWTFTEAVVAAFQGSARLDADDDGAIDLGEAQAHVRREMRFREGQLTLGRRSSGFPAAWVLAHVDPASRAARAGPWARGDYVEAQWKDRWWRAQVLEAGEGKAKVHYLGFEDSWDEWVPHERLRPPQPIAAQAGDLVEIEWKGRWWPGKVLEARDDFARITYDGFGPEWDEWVTSKRLRPRS